MLEVWGILSEVWGYNEKLGVQHYWEYNVKSHGYNAKSRGTMLKVRNTMFEVWGTMLKGGGTMLRYNVKSQGYNVKVRGTMLEVTTGGQSIQGNEVAFTCLVKSNLKPRKR